MNQTKSRKKMVKIDSQLAVIMRMTLKMERNMGNYITGMR